MKKLMLSLLPLLLVLKIKAQEVKNTRYFDVDNKEISQQVFKDKRATNTVLDIPGDSSNHHKLINREQQGKISNRKELISLLEYAAHEKINPSQQILIIYYPGKDACNTGGDVKFLISNLKEIEKGVDRIASTKTFYIYKDKEGLERYDNAIPWIKDPEQIVEKLFFKYHYPCNSFTVISKTGKYISYFGEFYKDLVLEASKKLRK
ncbi:hypothetical protein [Pedobacter miscanthi]|jgi:hypothetical protein|uniref:hypothetical protein n=1 Tax=Pedobacter miscanthi TaxID=2259170 RepID=UPI0029300B94|nr:hypothetical protein [Pedobacter miscanthi]